MFVKYQHYKEREKAFADNSLAIANLNERRLSGQRARQRSERSFIINVQKLANSAHRIQQRAISNLSRLLHGETKTPPPVFKRASTPRKTYTME